jgi:hypothetical protein
MAAGEYISVYSQKDSQDADIAKERAAQEHVHSLHMTQTSQISEHVSTTGHYDSLCYVSTSVFFTSATVC